MNINQLENTIINKIDKSKTIVRWIFFKLKYLILYFKNNYKIGDKRIEINNNTEWTIVGFIIDYYPRVGLLIQNKKDNNWYDTCSSRRWERDFKILNNE